MRIALPSIAALTAVLAGCGDVCASKILPTCDIRQASCQATVQEELRCMRGATSTALPPVSVLSLEEYEAYLRAGADPEMMRSLSWEGALELLRLLERGGDLFESSIDASLSNTLAFYSTREKAVYVIDRGMAADSVDAVATLAHELVHAAQDEEHDLDARLTAAATHEEVMLLRTVVEGEAMFYTNEAQVWHLGYGPGAIDWAGVHREWLDGVREQLDEAPSPYLVVYRQLPYVLGSRWATDRWQRGGDELVREGIPMPPESSAWLMVDPWSASGSPSPRTSIPCDPPPAPADFELRSRDEMGAPLVYAFLRRWGMTHAEAWSLALGWRADQLSVYGDPDGRVALAWRIDFDDTSTPRWVDTQIGSQPDPFRADYAETTVVMVASDDPEVAAGWSWTAEDPVCAPPP